VPTISVFAWSDEAAMDRAGRHGLTFVRMGLCNHSPDLKSSDAGSECIGMFRPPRPPPGVAPDSAQYSKLVARHFQAAMRSVLEPLKGATFLFHRFHGVPQAAVTLSLYKADMAQQWELVGLKGGNALRPDLLYSNLGAELAEPATARTQRTEAQQVEVQELCLKMLATEARGCKTAAAQLGDTLGLNLRLRQPPCVFGFNSIWDFHQIIGIDPLHQEGQGMVVRIATKLEALVSTGAWNQVGAGMTAHCRGRHCRGGRSVEDLHLPAAPSGAGAPAGPADQGASPRGGAARRLVLHQAGLA
jgi:hypothetical protein